MLEVVHMPVMINGETYYRTAEVCMEVGIGKTTLYRWMREKVINEAEYRDRKGWRLFTEDERDKLKVEANRVQKGHTDGNGKIAHPKGTKRSDGQEQMHRSGEYFSGISAR